MAVTEPDYRAFARDMLKLCKKHGVKLRACNEGLVLLGPAKAKTIGDSPYSLFRFSPIEAVIGDDGENPITMTREDG